MTGFTDGFLTAGDMGSDDEAPEEYRELKFKTGSEEESDDGSDGMEDSDVEGKFVRMMVVTA